MFRSLSVVNNRGDALLLNIFDPFSTGINVIDIDGIGPGKATINTVDIYGRDGSAFNSARKPRRDITITLEFLDKPSVETVRHKTYKHFPLKQEVTLIFRTDERELYITGRVESNEPKIFQQKESAVIVVSCFDPNFRKVLHDGEGVLTFSNLEGGLTFPINNEVGNKSLEFAELVANSMQSFYYDGDSPTGALVRMEAAYGPVVDPVIENHTTGEVFSVSTSKVPVAGGFVLGDTISINTNPGQKAIDLSRGDTNTSALRAVVPGSNWLTIVPGENVLSYSAVSGSMNMDVKFFYDTLYDGV